MRSSRKLTMASRQRGFSLVELVVVLTIVGLLAGMAVTMVTRVAAAQQDTRSRLVLATAADAALTRIADEVQAALPNSLRLTTNAEGVWFEWVPVLDAGRYRAASDTVAAAPGDVLDLNDPSDNAFDLIGAAVGTPAGSLPAGTSLVLQNMGTPEADAYAGSSRRDNAVLSAAGRHVAFVASGAWPASTSTQRFFLVATPVTLACIASAGGLFDLVRYSGYGWRAAQPASLGSAAWSGATRALLLGGLGSCSASYSNALANIGIVNLRLGLGLAGSGAAMSFMQQIALDNTP